MFRDEQVQWFNRLHQRHNWHYNPKLEADLGQGRLRRGTCFVGVFWAVESYRMEVPRAIAVQEFQLVSSEHCLNARRRNRTKRFEWFKSRTTEKKKTQWSLTIPDIPWVTLFLNTKGTKKTWTAHHVSLRRAWVGQVPSKDIFAMAARALTRLARSKILKFHL